jgi:hypothetical protein
VTKLLEEATIRGQNVWKTKLLEDEIIGGQIVLGKSYQRTKLLSDETIVNLTKKLLEDKLLAD